MANNVLAPPFFLRNLTLKVLGSAPGITYMYEIVFDDILIFLVSLNAARKIVKIKWIGKITKLGKIHQTSMLRKGLAADKICFEDTCNTIKFLRFCIQYNVYKYSNITCSFLKK